MLEDPVKTSEFWGRERVEERKHHWLEHPVTASYVNLRVSGDASTIVSQYWQQKYLTTPAEIALSLGCGFGNFERFTLSAGLAARMEAVDISPAAVEKAERYAADAGLSDRVSYSVKDLDRDSLPVDRYNAIFGIASVHHVRELERLFEQCRKALKKDGLLFLDEYIGPSQFQLKSPAVNLIRDLRRILPERYRKNIYLGGLAQDSYENPPLSWFDENDPSESIRSADIMEVLGNEFEIIDFRPYGGAILHMLLAGSAGNFDPAVEADAALLKVIALMEERLEDAGILTQDFAAIVARPRDTGPRSSLTQRSGAAGLGSSEGKLAIRGELSYADVNSPPDIWIALNGRADIEALAREGEVAPFPPPPLMHRVSGLTSPGDFAQHGCHFFQELQKASPIPMSGYRSILDFGVGSGRLARMFKGHSGEYVGADVDAELVSWVSSHLPWVAGVVTRPKERLPFEDGRFDCVISISVFTHMNDQDCKFYLRELHRITQPGAMLFLTIHGDRAVERAGMEQTVLKMLAMSDSEVEETKDLLKTTGFSFVAQQSHLASSDYEFGETFMSQELIDSRWSMLFDVVAIRSGAIYDFQDIVVLRRGN